MAHRLDYPIRQLLILSKKPFSANEGFRLVRDAARNIVYRYADENFQERFRMHTTFKSIYDTRTDEEKHRLVLIAIRNAIHYFEVWRINEYQVKDVNQQSKTYKEPTVHITAENVFQNMNSTVFEQSGIAGKPQATEKVNKSKMRRWIIGIILIILGGYLLFQLIAR